MGASDIRAGGAFVEISAKDARFVQALERSQARLKAWVREAEAQTPMTKGTEKQLLGGEGKGFLTGGFRGMQLFDTGLKLATAVMATKVALKDVAIFSAMARGDWEGMRKAAEALPFGLGEIVKELSGPVDAAFAAIVNRIKGLSPEDVYDAGAKAKADKDRKESGAQFSRFLKAFNEADKAAKRATLSTRELAAAEVAELNLTADQAQQVLALRLKTIGAGEEKDAAQKRAQARERENDLIRSAQDEYSKLAMTEEEYAAYEVRNMNLAAAAAQSLLNWKLAVIKTTKDQKKAEEDRKKAADDAQKAAQFREKLAQDDFDSEMNRLKRAVDEGRRMQEETLSPQERFEQREEELVSALAGEFIDEKTYRFQLRKALEDAAKDMPDAVAQTVGVQGTFSAFAAGRMGIGPMDRMAKGIDETAKNTRKIADLAAQWGVSFS
jgi:hypothetical protein